MDTKSDLCSAGSCFFCPALLPPQVAASTWCDDAGSGWPRQWQLPPTRLALLRGCLPLPPQCAITACSAYMYIPRILPAGVAIATCGPGAHASVGAQRRHPAMGAHASVRAQHRSHRACSSPADQGTGAHADGRGFLRMERLVREASGSRVVRRRPALGACHPNHVRGQVPTTCAASIAPLVRKHRANVPYGQQIRNSTRLDQASNTRLAVACSTAHKACGALASRGS